MFLNGNFKKNNEQRKLCELLNDYSLKRHIIQKKIKQTAKKVQAN